MPTNNPIELASFSSYEDSLNIDALTIRAQHQKGTVIFCHGRGETKESFIHRYIELCIILLRNGFNILAFDFRGHGKSAPAEYSFGFHEQKDVLGAIGYLKGSSLEHEHIGILGFSMGAAAAMLAVERTEGIKALVSESGYSSFENIGIIFDEDKKPVPLYTPQHKKAVEALKKRLGWNFNISPIEHIKRISPCALFLIDGKFEEKDNLLMFDEAEEPKELWIVPNARHGQVYSMVQKEYDKRVSEFFLKRLT